MPHNAESLFDFSHRIEDALMYLLKKEKGKNIVVFTHSGVIRTLLAWCLKMDYLSTLQFQKFAIDYASITQINIYHGESDFSQLIKLNQTI